jgi:hypothetical protein
MSKRTPETREDIYECREKIQTVLREYNCELIDFDEGSCVLLVDLDTDKTISATSKDS